MNIAETAEKMKSNIGFTKWMLVALSLAAGYVFFWESIVAFAVGTAKLALVAVFGTVLMFTYPALCEFLASLGWRLWQKAIEGDPIARLERDLEASAAEIDQYEKSVARANSAIDTAKKTIARQTGTVDASDLVLYEEQVKSLEDGRDQLIAQRDEMVLAYQRFEKALAQYRGKYEISNAFKGALEAFRFNKKTGGKSEGARIAFEAIDRDLTQSHEALKLVMSRPKPAITA